MQQRKLFMGNVLHQWYWWDLCLQRTNMWRGWVLVLCGSILDMWLCLRWVAVEQSIVSPGQKVEKRDHWRNILSKWLSHSTEIKACSFGLTETNKSFHMGELSLCNSIYKINVNDIIIIICFCVSHCVKLMIKEPRMEQIVLNLARKNV